MLPSLDTIVVENYSLLNPRMEFTLERNTYRFTGHKQDAILRLTPPGGREDAFILLTEGVHIDGKRVLRDEALREILDPFRRSQTTSTSKTKSQVSPSLFIDYSQIDLVKVEEKESTINIYGSRLIWNTAVL